jgi:hypothetical protein
MAAGVVHIPWYATGLRANVFADALAHFAALAPRYGATGFQVFRSRDDRYKFLQTATFETKLDWERYWEGEDAITFRVNHQGWYQVPVLYYWTDLLATGEALAPAKPTADPGPDPDPTESTPISSPTVG